MATLKEIYAQLDVLITELEDIVENETNSNKASDIQKDVLDGIETATIKLDGIIDDENAGLYESREDDEFLEDLEDFGNFG
tara:strand:- start:721 stop:963 length:243 start_codon:yes stop_codon:yes gene_type:complete